MKEIVIIIGAIFLASCASVGAVIDGGKDLSMSVVDSTIKTASNITNAALDDVSSVVDTVGDSVGNVIDNVVEEIDEQTDELQKPEEDKQEK
tara:strand:+ start:50 stop:325 length:276 start_codon:yes stop_codon:yes gene_type:complete